MVHDEGQVVIPLRLRNSSTSRTGQRPCPSHTEGILLKPMTAALIKPGAASSSARQERRSLRIGPSTRSGNGIEERHAG